MPMDGQKITGTTRKNMKLLIKCRRFLNVLIQIAKFIRGNTISKRKQKAQVQMYLSFLLQHELTCQNVNFFLLHKILLNNGFHGLWI